MRVSPKKRAVALERVDVAAQGFGRLALRVLNDTAHEVRRFAPEIQERPAVAHELVDEHGKLVLFGDGTQALDFRRHVGEDDDDAIEPLAVHDGVIGELEVPAAAHDALRKLRNRDDGRHKAFHELEPRHFRPAA